SHKGRYSHRYVEATIQPNVRTWREKPRRRLLQYQAARVKIAGSQQTARRRQPGPQDAPISRCPYRKTVHWSLHTRNELLLTTQRGSPTCHRSYKGHQAVQRSAVSASPRRYLLIWKI